MIFVSADEILSFRMLSLLPHTALAQHLSIIPVGRLEIRSLLLEIQHNNEGTILTAMSSRLARSFPGIAESVQTIEPTAAYDMDQRLNISHWGAISQPYIPVNIRHLK